MTKKSVMLQRKLHEFESELNDVFRLPLDATASDPRNQMSFDDMKKRFRFLSRLLAAEVASQPKNSDQLHVLRHKLTGLEAAFCHWNESRTRTLNNDEDTLSKCSDSMRNDVIESGSPIPEAGKNSGENSSEKFMDSGETDGDVKKEEVSSQPETSGNRLAGHKRSFPDSIESETDALALYDHDDTWSICSDCTQTLRCDKSGSPNVSREKSPEKLSKDDEMKIEEEKVRSTMGKHREEDVWSKGKYCGVFGCGIIVGAICMLTLFSFYDNFIHYQPLLLPPT